MRRRIFLLVAAAVMTLAAVAADTGLFTYDGGYFIKDGRNWTEYRPGEQGGKWRSYTQTAEEENYYKIKDGDRFLAVPKRGGLDFYIWKNDDWQKLYGGRQVFDYFNDTARDIYCYTDGYFVRDGDEWREYRPGDKTGLWARYTQYSNEENYFKAESEKDNVAIPKESASWFYVHRNGEWQPIYSLVSIYDAHSRYDFSFHYAWFEEDPEGKGKTVRKPACISFDRKGNGLIEFDGKTCRFTFGNISSMALKGTDNFQGVKLYNDNGDGDFIFILENRPMVEMEDVAPSMDFMECSGKSDLMNVRKLVDDGKFFKQ